MKTSEIQQTVCREEILKGNLPCENVGHLLSWECDVLSINKSGYLSEFEVKITRSDFLAEKKKVRKWQLMNARSEWTCPNYFWYVCPVDLISQSEIPDYAGLIHITNSGASEIIRKPVLLHKGKKDRIKVLNTFCRIISERKYLGSCMLTYQNKKIRERNLQLLS